MVYKLLHVGFWAREGATTVTIGNSGSGMPSSTTVNHQAFNYSKSLPVPRIELGEERMDSSDSLDPLVISDTIKESVELEFSDMIYRDPFLLLTLFNEKAVSSQSNWNSGQVGTITADFSTNDHYDSIMYQVRQFDASGSADHIDWTFLGGQLTKYQWVAERGKLMRESFTIKFMNSVSNTRAFITDSNFDDGKTRPNAVWDQDGPFLSNGVTYEKGGSAISGFTITKGTLTISTPKAQEADQSSQIATVFWDEGPREFTVELEGWLTSEAQITEAQLSYANKTKSTFEMIYNDAGGSEERKIQATQVYLFKVDYDGDGIPEAGKPVKAKLTFKAGVSNTGTRTVISFSGKWAGDDHTDPYAATPRRINVDTR